MADKFKPQLEWNLPLSGAVTMPITMPSFTGGSMSGGQIGLFNIDLGNSADPALERKLIDAAGSYGKQIGRLCDVVALMLKHMEAGTPLNSKDPMVVAFRKMARLIDATKDDHQG